MPGYNKSPLAFDDLRVVFQRAMEAPIGLRVICKSRSEAVITRSRLNYLRKMDRKENAITYQSDHPMYMRSVWDRLVLRIPPKGQPDEAVIYIEKRRAENLILEEIEEITVDQGMDMAWKNV
jgi:hypothetical protein